jgi:hypothetical protein
MPSTRHAVDLLVVVGSDWKFGVLNLAEVVERHETQERPSFLWRAEAIGLSAAFATARHSITHMR